MNDQVHRRVRTLPSWLDSKKSDLKRNNGATDTTSSITNKKSKVGSCTGLTSSLSCNNIKIKEEFDPNDSEITVHDNFCEKQEPQFSNETVEPQNVSRIDSINVVSTDYDNKRLDSPLKKESTIYDPSLVKQEPVINEVKGEQNISSVNSTINVMSGINDDKFVSRVKVEPTNDQNILSDNSIGDALTNGSNNETFVSPIKQEPIDDQSIQSVISSSNALSSGDDVERFLSPVKQEPINKQNSPTVDSTISALTNDHSNEKFLSHVKQESADISDIANHFLLQPDNSNDYPLQQPDSSSNHSLQQPSNSSPIRDINSPINVGSTMNSPKRPVCKYGSRCYRCVCKLRACIFHLSLINL